MRGRGSPYAALTLPPFSFNAARQFGDSGGVALRRQFEMPPWGAGFARASHRAFQAFLRTALELQGVFGGRALFCAAWVRLSHYFAAGAHRQAPFTDMGRPKRGASGIFYGADPEARQAGGLMVLSGAKGTVFGGSRGAGTCTAAHAFRLLVRNMRRPVFWRAGRFELQLPLR